MSHRRRSVRLDGYDYSLPGAYFVTICTMNRAWTLGKIVEGNMEPSKVGKIVIECWNDIPRHFTGVRTTSFQLMPNHIHGILGLRSDVPKKSVGTRHARPTEH